MTRIEVRPLAGDAFEVTLTDDRSATTHTVTAAPAFVADLGAGGPVEVITASFRFLLEREPKESILGSFDLAVIGDYFPEYPERIGDHLVTGAEAAARAAFTAEGLAPSPWSAGPGDRFGEHHHDRDKVLICVAGGIVFHLAAGDHALAAGGRLDLPAGTLHSATVGPRGVTCWEAFR